LAIEGPYDEVKDLQFYHLKDASTRLHMPPGFFAIFYPSDAHLPRVSDGCNASVYKLVIKIALHLLNGSSGQYTNKSEGDTP